MQRGGIAAFERVSESKASVFAPALESDDSSDPSRSVTEPQDRGRSPSAARAKVPQFRDDVGGR